MKPIEIATIVATMWALANTVVLFLLMVSRRGKGWYDWLVVNYVLWMCLLLTYSVSWRIGLIPNSAWHGVLVFLLFDVAAMVLVIGTVLVVREDHRRDR